MGTTLRAMKRIEEIREAREARFKLLRRKGVKALQKDQALKEIKQNIDLVIAPLARKKQELAQAQGLQVASTTEKKKSTKNWSAN